MKIGFNLPINGRVAGPQAIIRVAKRAEELGYDSLWVHERLLNPVQPQTPYPASPDGQLPEAYHIGWLDPLHSLTFAAANTSRIALGTSIINMPYYNPILLARELTTLDVLSGGRLIAGFGQAWSKDEVDVTSGAWKERGARADEFLKLLLAIWTTDPVEFHGKFFNLPKSSIKPKPVQKPHPPIYLASYGSPGPTNRIAKFANGWTPVGVPLDAMSQMMGQMRDLAGKAGRNPSELKLVVRANFHVTDQPLGEKRWIFTGSEEEVKSDIQATKKIADEIFFDPSFEPMGTTLEGFLKRMEQAKSWVA